MSDPSNVFACRNLRCTKQRQIVYQALADTKTHPTAEELHHMVRQEDAGISLATVYNALEAFCDSGLCRKIATIEGGTRFDAQLHDHLHIITSDGRVMDVPDEVGARLLGALSGELLKEIEQRMGVRIGRVSIELEADSSTD